MITGRRIGWIAAGLVLAALLAACAGSGAASTCGAEVCVTDIRILRPAENTVTILFELTDANGSIDPAVPPTFANGLNVTLLDEEEERRYLVSRDFAPEEFTCAAGTNIPGAEGRQAAACLLTLGADVFASLPQSGSTILINFYSENFPIVLRDVRFP